MPATNSNALFPIPERQETAPAVRGQKALAEARASGRLEAQKARVGESAMRDLLRVWFRRGVAQTNRVLFRPYNGVSGWVEFTPTAIRMVKEDHWAGPERPLIERLLWASVGDLTADHGSVGPAFRFHLWSTSAGAAVMRAMIFGQLRETLDLATNEAVLAHPVVQIVRASEAGAWRAAHRQQAVAQ